jgi:hypothetical protein
MRILKWVAVVLSVLFFAIGLANAVYWLGYEPRGNQVMFLFGGVCGALLQALLVWIAYGLLYLAALAYREIKKRYLR